MPSPHPSRPWLQDLALDVRPGTGPDAGAGLAEALLACPGVAQAHVDTYLTWALVTYEPDRTGPAQITRAMGEAGYDVRATRVFDPDEPGSRPLGRLRHRR